MSTLVLAGVSGDLAGRKLLPALRTLASEGQLPFNSVIGTARREVIIDPGAMGERFSTRQLDIGNAADVALLAKDIEGEVVVYLSLPPGTAPAVAAALKQGGLGRARLLLEKPFGFDAESATTEAAQIAEYFPEAQVYRVDHFLFKALAQKVAALGKDTNHIEVLASEDSAVGHRANFYEQTGALRDFGNHLLSLAGVVYGDRGEFLQQATVTHATRAQYDKYPAEVGNNASEVETFFSLELGVGATKVLLASGKGLALKDTQVCINGTAVFHDRGDRAYEEVLLAAAKGERHQFLSLHEVLASWRILDQARARWGTLANYKRGSNLSDLLHP